MERGVGQRQVFPKDNLPPKPDRNKQKPVFPDTQTKPIGWSVDKWINRYRNSKKIRNG